LRVEILSLHHCELTIGLKIDGVNEIKVMMRKLEEVEMKKENQLAPTPQRYRRLVIETK
jgi:hypothetical protein